MGQDKHVIQPEMPFKICGDGESHFGSEIPFFFICCYSSIFSHSFEECFAGGGKVVYACEERCRAKTGIPISDRLIKMPKKKYFSTYAYDGVSTICRILFSYNV